MERKSFRSIYIGGRWWTGGILVRRHTGCPCERDTMIRMFNIASAIASVFGRGQTPARAATAQSPDWLQLPAWTHGKTVIEVPQHHGIAQYQEVLGTHTRSSAATLRQIKMSGIYAVNLEDTSCTCRQWEQEKKDMPVNDLRRVCAHIAKAIRYRKAEFDGAWNEWTLRILYALESEASHRIVKSFTSGFFDNGKERFLAVYDNTCGYVQLYGENDECFGYDSMRNRWGWGAGPNNPLEVKRKLRPWIESLDARFKNGKFGNS